MIQSYASFGFLRLASVSSVSLNYRNIRHTNQRDHVLLLRPSCYSTEDQGVEHLCLQGGGKVSFGRKMTEEGFFAASPMLFGKRFPRG